MFKEYEYNKKIMGMDLSVAIVCDDKKLADKIFAEKFAELQEYEKRFSRFLPDSELSRLNKDKEIVASAEFIEVIKVARELYKETGGYFNPLVQIAKFGYDKDFKSVKGLEKSASVEKYNVDFDLVEINESTRVVKLQPDQNLDFGGFLKGYLAKKIAREIFGNKKTSINGVIVNIGGDLFTLGRDTDNNQFIFDIYNPITDTNDLQIKLLNQGMATSGTYKRSWKVGDSITHHILDESGLKNPDNGAVSVTVVHDNGARADAYTKLFISAGTEKALAILKDQKIKFLIINKNGEVINNLQ